MQLKVKELTFTVWVQIKVPVQEVLQLIYKTLYKKVLDGHILILPELLLIILTVLDMVQNF
jgi:hypothetical protein